eukprot:PLAT3816.1.p1 GENE.PLAT3816.1~~PLAT3816.1.p1  ORF type:complete len:231 (-),score=76.25 PLAT3816.1:158-850(-)
MGDVELGTKTRAAPKDGGETAIDFGKMGGKKAEPERPKDSTDFIAKAARTAAEEEEMPCLQLHLRRNWKKYVVAILLLGTLGTLAGIFLLPKNPGVQVTAITPTSVRTRRSLISPAFIAELQFAFTVTNPNYIEVAAQTLNATMFYKDEQLASRSLLYPQAELITAASERAVRCRLCQLSAPVSSRRRLRRFLRLRSSSVRKLTTRLTSTTSWRTTAVPVVMKAWRWSCG